MKIQILRSFEPGMAAARPRALCAGAYLRCDEATRRQLAAFQPPAAMTDPLTAHAGKLHVIRAVQ
jgi:hypothetical protein